jgi:hypothetical protein
MDRMTDTLIRLGRRLTAVLDTGTHPATGALVLQSEACGTCAHHTERTFGDGTTRTKCAIAGACRGGPNLPPHTPACILWRPANPASDAA